MMNKRVLLVAAKTGYQVREFYNAAEFLGFDLVLATDRCHILDDPWADRATPVQFANAEAAIYALRNRGPFAGIIAVGDQPALAAAEIAESLGLHFHPSESVRAANDKFLTRERFRSAGMLAPSYSLDPAHEPKLPCVVKPLHLSASRGVIRANNSHEFVEALARIRKIAGNKPILVEDFIPGGEFAVEGVVTGGRLQTLAIFDKPDPLDGPFFEETIYVTPSREPLATQQSIQSSAQQAIAALGLTDGPVHAEMRVNARGVWMLEAAARPIGGLCARSLKFCRGADQITLEELLLRHAVGQDVYDVTLAPGAHGVMMIPIAESGVFQGARGEDDARRIPGITTIEITAKEGQKLEALPEGASYLGFIFARAATAQDVELALRAAHSRLKFQFNPALPVLR